MKNKNNLVMADRHLAETFYSSSRYNALLLGVAGFGFIVIYLLAQFGVLGEPAPQLLYISGSIFLLVASQFPLRSVAKRGRGILANLLALLAVILFAILLVSFWDGIGILVALVVVFISARTITSGLPGRFPFLSLILTAVGLAGLYYANTNPFAIERLQTNTIAAVSSLVFLVSTGILLFTVFIISQSTKFKTLQSLLLLSFAIIVIIPTAMTATLSAIGSYSNNQALTLDTLEAISKLKETRLNDFLKSVQDDTDKIVSDQVFESNVLRLLSPGDTAALALESAKGIVRFRIQNAIGLNVDEYNEILILDIKGNVAASSLPSNEGTFLGEQPFYRKGLIQPFTGFAYDPSVEKEDLVVSRPLFDRDGKTIRGILALRLKSDKLNEIMQLDTGIAQVETYLVDRNLKPLTSIRQPIDTIITQATTDATGSGFTSASGSYENYAGEAVFGYYTWYEPMEVIFITEAPVSIVVSNSINSLLGSVLIASVIILIAISAVVVSARTIVEPITSLAKTTESFASGTLTARARIERADEIGALAQTYNMMAEQLQDTIGQLEQRVTDRTRQLEDQTLRLRVAAEIAKDAASARDVSELLERAGKLIQERFGLYHTGIFLLDKNAEFAVLAASPTDAGRQMVAKGHKLRVGEVGIVGRVAASGEPRISLDTGHDAVHFNNPLLPNTRSEMALPLKTENQIIGVLDVQSDQSQAFNDDDIAIIQVLADQLATAIERTRLLQQVEQNLLELEKAYGRATRESWRTFSESGMFSHGGYRFDNVRIQPIKEASTAGSEAMQSGKMIVQSGSKNENRQSVVAIPIKIRGHAVGAVTVKLKEGYNPATIATLEQAIDRLAGSLESARLFEEARQRASHEQAISHVTTAISAAPEFDAILRTTVEEIGRLLGESEVSIQVIGNDERS